MKMAQIDLGLGFGVNDLRVVFVFHSTRAYTAFVNDGWDFGGQLDLTAKTLDQGPSAIGEMTIDAETTVFTMSKEGAMAKVNLAGTKYWKDESLNRALY
jgi:lipid-binding SYLF domain-containing protein